MPRDTFLRLLRQRLHWLLCLALLLPMAQLATAAHAVTHTSESGQQAGDLDAKAHLQHCPLCTAAAVLGANALPGTPAHVVLLDMAAVAPHAAPAATAAAPDFGLPANRGPPLLLP